MVDQVYVVTTTEYASEEYSPACDETTTVAVFSSHFAAELWVSRQIEDKGYKISPLPLNPPPDGEQRLAQAWCFWMTKANGEERWGRTASSRWIEKEEVGKCRLNPVGEGCHVFVPRWVKEESRLMVAKQLYEEASYDAK